METIIIAERKRKYWADLIISAILLIGALICLVIWSAPLPFIIFIVIVLLIIPSFVISGYIWDITSKISLSKDEVIISYGRSIMDIVHFEGSFTVPQPVKLKWKNIADFEIESYTQQSSGGSDGATTTTTNDYLIINVIGRDELNRNTSSRHSIRLRRFEKSPDEILKLCKQFQKDFT